MNVFNARGSIDNAVLANHHPWEIEKRGEIFYKFGGKKS